MNQFFKASLLLALLPFAALLEARKKSCFACLPIPAAISSRGLQPVGIDISPNGKCIATATDRNIALFAIKSKCCTINPTATSLGTIFGAYGLKFSPDGSCLVSANSYDNTVTVWGINECSCTITPEPLNKFTFATYSVPTDVAFSPDGHFVAVSLQFSNQVAIFGFNKTDCSLSGPQLFSLPSNTSAPWGLAYSKNGCCLAVANSESNSVTVFKVNTSTGSLESPTVVSTTGIFPTEIAFSPENNFFAVANVDGTVTVFALNQSTCTASVVDSAFSGSGARGISYSQDGKCLIVVNGTDSTFTIFSVNKCTGKITAIQTEQFPEGTNPFYLTRKGNCFVASGFDSNTLNPFTIGCCGQSTKLPVKQELKKEELEALVAKTRARRTAQK